MNKYTYHSFNVCQDVNTQFAWQANEIAAKEAAQVAKRREIDAQAAELARQKAAELDQRMAGLPVPGA